MADLPAEIRSGDQRRALVAIRDALAVHFAACEPNVVAQIAARLQAVIVAIAALPAETGKVPVKDDLKARRANRLAASKAAAPPARPRKQRGG